MDEEKVDGKPRIVWIDLVRVIGALLVVMIHVNSQALRDWGEIPLSWWMVKNIFNATARIAVPLFFMVSGYLLLQKNEDIFVFFRKRGFKILLPFLAWSVIFLIALDKAQTPREFVVRILTDRVAAHLWFLYPLIGIYLVVPFLRVFTSPDKKIYLYFFVGMWVIAQPVYAMLEKSLGEPIAFPLSFFEGYVGYFILGYLLGQIKVNQRVLAVGGIVWLAAALFTILITYYLTAEKGKFNGIYYTYLQPNIILASVGAYLLLMWAGEWEIFQKPGLQKVIVLVSQTSFGIYLIHPLVMKMLRSLTDQVDAWIANPVWGTPLVTLLVFGLSFAATILLQKVPLVKRLVP
ncbi:MAG: acyltransferase family protein [Chloroflexota bacterium]